MLPPNQQDDAPAQPDQQDNEPAPSINPLIVITAAATTIVAAVAIMTFKKKYKLKTLATKR